MRLALDFNKSLQENADNYFAKSKKAKSKLENLGAAKKLLEERLRLLDEEEIERTEIARKKEGGIKRKKEWFEKFRWFNSSDGFLVIGGRDAGTNEAIVKKHMEDCDAYFHAEIIGAPHVAVKTGGREIPESTKIEAAIFAASYSSAWREGISYVDVYSVKPEQVSKEAPSGESLGKGAFVIRGKREWFRKTNIELAIGLVKTNDSLAVVSGPKSAVEKKAVIFFGIKQGRKEKSDAAKEIKKRFEKSTGKRVSLDEIIAMLPSGGMEITMGKNPSGKVSE